MYMPEYRSPINGAVLPRGKPFTKGEAQREIARKGAAASNKVQREKRNCKQLASLILSAPAPVNEKQREELAKLLGVDAEEISINLVSTYAQAQKAAKGDLHALMYLRDTAGERPTERVEMNMVDQSVFSEVEEFLYDGDGKS